ncbi:hypothetical protein OAL55_03140 [Verrucomicrobiales bacterium]|nr:hypothetical protein [Verrucomicrobiales bacterium]
MIAANPDATGQRVFVRAGTSGNLIDNSGSISAAAVELKAHGNAFALAINNSGSVRATGVNRSGGRVFLNAGAGMVQNSGTIRATMPGGDGGRILIEAAKARLGGTIDASGEGNGDGGTIEVISDDVEVTGSILANGRNGGTISVMGQNGAPSSTINVRGGGVISANGTSGNGGSVTLLGNNVMTEANSLISATGSVDGGSVRVTGVNSASINGAINVGGAGGLGGSAIIDGANVELGSTASIDASGLTGGGNVNVGGGFQGNDENIINATDTVISNGAQIAVDAIGNGNAGVAVIWANNSTLYRGEISARSFAKGNGGLVEVSGRNALTFDGLVSTLAEDGKNGTLLLDPTNMTISNSANSANNINNGTLNGLLNAGNVVVSTESAAAEAGTITITSTDLNNGNLGRILWNSANSLSLLAEGDVYVGKDILNQGAGNINIVAGWDSTALPLATLLGGVPTSPGTTAGDVDMDASIFDTANFGTGNGSVYVGTIDAGITGSNTNVVIGSREGQTNVAGFDVNLLPGIGSTGENRYTQIGYDREDGGTAVALASSGRIRVQAVNDVNLIANRDGVGGIGDTGGAGRYAYAQIGHGGNWGSARQELKGDVTVEAGNDIIGRAGQNRENFVHIGHGGIYGDDVNNQGVLGGAITVNAGGDLDFRGGTGLRSFAQVGHGGWQVRATDYDDNPINVTVGGDIHFQGGTGAININGRESYAQLGNGGYNASTRAANSGHKGDINVIAGGQISFLGGDMRDNYVQLGNGGRSARPNGAGSGGSISVQAGTGITFLAGTLSDRATTNVNQDGSASDINDDGRMSAMLGHGGWDTDASGANARVAGVGHYGDISVVTTTGDITFAGGSVAEGSTGAGQGRMLMAQIGHGGIATTGDHRGSIDVEATVGSINFTAGNADDNSGDRYHYAMIGHGAAGAAWGNSAAFEGDLSAASQDGGTDGIRVTAGNAINFRGGQASALGVDTNSNQNFAMIGLGGYNYEGNHSADITVTAGAGGVNFNGGQGNPAGTNRGNQNFAMIGNGGTSTRGDHTGNISVSAINGGAINFIGGTAREGYVQIGHGGWDADAPNGSGVGNPGNSGTIDVSTVGGGDISFLAGTNYRSWSSIGHGGLATNGEHSGDITVNSSGAITFTAGQLRYESYVQLGHGGYEARSDNTGDIDVDAVGAITFTGGVADRNYAQLGHGGYNADNPNNGDFTDAGNTGAISVLAGGDITIQAGDDYRAWAQFGHGGFDTYGNHSGDIDVTSTGGKLLVASGAGGNQWADREAYAQLGHGGYNARGDHSGSITVEVETGLEILSGNNGRQNYTQIGHGGYDADNPNYGFPGYFSDPGQVDPVANPSGVRMPTAAERVGNSGDISITVNGGGLDLIAGNFENNYAHVGHGGRNTSGDHSGDVTVGVTGDIMMDSVGLRGDPNGGQAGSHYTQIGHGGVYASGSHTGDVSVTATGKIDMYAGPSSAYSHIGHGGRNEHGTGNQGSDITVNGDGTRAGSRLFNRYVASNNDYFPGTISGNITVDAGGDLNLIGYDRSPYNRGGGGTYVQIGNGGFRYDADPNSVNGSGHNGTIDVSSGGSIVIRSGAEIGETYGMIGHGGYQAYGNHGHDGSGSQTASKVTVSATDDITMIAEGGRGGGGWGERGYRNAVQIGHGGWDSDFKANQNMASFTWWGDIDPDNALTSNPLDPNDFNPKSPLGTQTATYAGDADAGLHPLTPVISVNAEGKQLINQATLLGTLGDVEVTAGGDVTVRSYDEDRLATQQGNGNTYWGVEAYASVGNGGYGVDGNHAGDVTVHAGGAIEFSGTRGVTTQVERSTVQLGNGGYASRGMHSGIIDAMAGAGGISFLGGDHTQNYAMLGHGGWDSDAPNNPPLGTVDGHSGNISVLTTDGGDVIFQASVGTNSFVQLGHGGSHTRTNHSGDISVVSDGKVRFAAGTGTSAAWGDPNTAHETYAQLGHGGRENDGNHSGDIKVRAKNQLELIASESALRGYAHIGHGGERANGSQTGDISVVVGSGTSIIQSGQDGFGHESYAQIGQGGFGASNGNKTGNVEFITTDGGDLNIFSSNNGANGNSYVQIGNGGTSLNGADVLSGNVTVIVDGELSLERGANSELRIGNRGATLGAGDLTVLADSIDFDSTATDNLLVITNQVANSQIQNVWISPYLANNLGDVTIGTTGAGEVHWNQDYDYTSDKDLNLVSGSNIYFTRRIRNRLDGSTGAVNVVAGWDGVTGGHTLDFTEREVRTTDFDISAIKQDGIDNGELATAFGNNDGDVVLGKDPTGAFQDGSISLGSAQGATNVLGRDVLMAAGTLTPTNDWRGSTIIGIRDGTSYDITGDIMVHATRDVLMSGATPGVGPNNGGSRASVSMIGHGGFDNEGRNRDKLTGMIYVDAGRNVIAKAGDNRDNWVKIGHGGRVGYNAANVLGEIGGEIEVKARTGNIEFSGGQGLYTFAQLGHGGRDVDPEALDSVGGINSDIHVTAGGDIIFKGGTGGLDGSQESFAQLGNGGIYSDVRKDGEGWYGDITVAAGGKIEFKAGEMSDNYAQLGNGGRSAHGVHSGDISVTAGTGISFIAGTVSANEGANDDGRLYAQLGHGGYDSDAANVTIGGNNYVAGDGHSGDISVITTLGDINFFGGDTALGSVGAGTGRQLYAQLGHGGAATQGDHAGSINVSADDGSIYFQGGNATDNDGDKPQYAHLGHGGALYNWGGDNAALSSNSVSGGTDGINVNAGTDIRFVGGAQQDAYAQLGLGGAHGKGDKTGDITVTAGGLIEFLGGSGNRTYAQLGNGGYEGDGVMNGDIAVSAGNGLTFRGGTNGGQSFTLLGHGGHQAGGNKTGDISVVTTAGDILFAAGATPATVWEANAALGHGGVRANGISTGNITADSAGAITIQGGTGRGASSQIGHGVREERGGGNTGDIVVIARGGGISLLSDDGAGGGERSYTMIGHGGENVDGAHSGKIVVVSEGDLLLDAGNDNHAFSQIGHGGADVPENHSGDIVVSVDGDIELRSGSGGGNRYAAIGHGDGNNNANNVHDGSMMIRANGEVSLVNNGDDVQITHFDAFAAGNNYAFVAEGLDTATGNSGLNNITITDGIWNAYESILNNGGEATIGALGAGNLIMQANAAAAYNSTADLNLLSQNNITFLEGVQNAGTGSVNVVAGWDGLGFAPTAGFMGGGVTPLGHGDLDMNYCPPFSTAYDFTLNKTAAGVVDPTTFGLNSGSVFIGNGTQTAGIFVGSRDGNTNILGYGVDILGSNSTGNLAQVGFNAPAAGGDATGNIMVETKEDGLTMTANANNAYALVGHGGIGGTGNATGMIRVDTTHGTTAGDIIMNSGGGTTAFTQIGHGGAGFNGNHGAAGATQLLEVVGRNIDLNAGGGNDSFARIGHGGRGITGSMAGDISVTVENGGAVTLDGGGGSNAQAQIGLGGVAVDGTKDGVITVSSAAGVSLTGGTGSTSAARIGHGGNDGDGASNGVISVTSTTGDISINGD